MRIRDWSSDVCSSDLPQLHDRRRDGGAAGGGAMNGAHDMGGMHGFGPVRDEPEDTYFHGEWEKRAFALTLACGGLRQWTIDRSEEHTSELQSLMRISYAVF